MEKKMRWTKAVYGLLAGVSMALLCGYTYPHDYPAPVLTGREKLVIEWEYSGPPCDFYVKFWKDPSVYGSGELLGYIEGESPHRFVVESPECGYYGVIGVVENGSHILHATERPTLIEVPCP